MMRQSGDILKKYLEFSTLADFLVLVLTCKAFYALINDPKMESVCLNVFFSAFPCLRSYEYPYELAPLVKEGLFAKMGLKFLGSLKSCTNPSTNRKRQKLVKFKFVKMKMTGRLAEAVSYLNEAKPEMLWSRIGDGHPISRVLKQYLPQINFAKCWEEKRIPELDTKEEYSFEPKKLLDSIFIKTVNKQNLQAIQEEITQNLLLKEDKFKDLAHLFVLGFACYQLKLCHEIVVLIKGQKLNPPVHYFLQFSIVYGEIKILEYFFSKENRGERSQLKHDSRSVEDVELQNFFQIQNFPITPPSPPALNLGSECKIIGLHI